MAASGLPTTGMEKPESAMTDYWFAPHAYGYGATPANWKGWAAVAGYLAVVLALVLSVAALPADLPEGPWAWQVATLTVMIAALTLGFIRLCRKKTDGQWAWRWGSSAEDPGATRSAGSASGTLTGNENGGSGGAFENAPRCSKGPFAGDGNA